MDIYGNYNIKKHICENEYNTSLNKNQPVHDLFVTNRVKHSGLMNFKKDN